MINILKRLDKSLSEVIHIMSDFRIAEENHDYRSAGADISEDVYRLQDRIREDIRIMENGYGR